MVGSAKNASRRRKVGHSPAGETTTANSAIVDADDGDGAGNTGDDRGNTGSGSGGCL